MFSATFSKAAREIAREYLSDEHTRIRVGRAGSSHKNVVQTVSIQICAALNLANHSVGHVG